MERSAASPRSQLGAFTLYEQRTEHLDGGRINDTIHLTDCVDAFEDVLEKESRLDELRRVAAAKASALASLLTELGEVEADLPKERLAMPHHLLPEALRKELGHDGIEAHARRAEEERVRRVRARALRPQPDISACVRSRSTRGLRRPLTRPSHPRRVRPRARSATCAHDRTVAARAPRRRPRSLSVARGRAGVAAATKASSADGPEPTALGLGANDGALPPSLARLVVQLNHDDSGRRQPGAPGGHVPLHARARHTELTDELRRRDAAKEAARGRQGCAQRGARALV